MTDLTKEAAEGFDWHRQGIATSPLSSVTEACPYLNTSPAAMAWHLGRFLASHRDWNESRPTPDAALPDTNRIAVTMGRGDTLNVRGRKQILLGRFRWNPDNSFTEVRA